MSRSPLTVLTFAASLLVVTPVQAAALDAKTPDDATAKIEQALEATTMMSYLDTHLHDVATDLTLRHKISIQIDKESLDAAGLAPDMPLTADLKDLPLASALNRLFHGTALDWTVRDEILLITTREAASSMTATKVYALPDLASRPGFQSRDLIDVLTKMLTPADWQDNGGTVGLVSWSSTLKALVVTTTYREQRNVRALLNLLAGAAAENPGDDPSAGTAMFPRDEIDAALRSKTEVQYLKTPLEDVVTNLYLKHRVRMAIDKAALDADGIPVDVPITAMLKDVLLASALNRILHPKGLDWTVTDGVIVITTKSATESPSYSQIRLYPVADLVDFDDGNDPSADLLVTLTTVVTPDQWADNGGTKADFVSYIPSRGIVIRHDEQGHREVAALLRQLRAAKAQLPATTEKENERLSVKFYSIADLDGAFRAGEKDALQTGQPHFVDDAAVLVRTLLQEVRPDSWEKTKEGDGPSVMVDRLTRSLVVRQTAKGHRDVAAFLDKVRSDLDPTHVGFGGPSMSGLNATGGGGGFF